jgi:aminocarboxymuconate-semialdehyde decarboxylase
MNDIEGTVEEIDRAVNELDALGVQIFTNVNGAPLDDPRFDPIFVKMAEVDRTIWVHPYRNEKWPDYPTEPKSRYELWWVFGWPYETSVFMARLALSGLFDRYPNLRILTHHGGAMAPYFSGRIGPGLDQLGTRTPDEDLTSVTRELKKRPFDYFKMFYADTALFGAPHALECAIKFFGADRVLFASDMPFDPENGALYIPSTISDVDALQISESERQKIYEGNAQRVLGVRLP